jgi:hypothetical protein
MGRHAGDTGVRGSFSTHPIALSARPEHDGLSGERVWAHRGDDRDLLVEGRASSVALGLKRARTMNFPDLAPWLDNVSDDYDELPSEGHEVPYDE